jgi:hypothetical protein
VPPRHHAAITIGGTLRPRHHAAITIGGKCFKDIYFIHLAGNEDGGRAHPAERSLRAGNGNGGRGLPALASISLAQVVSYVKNSSPYKLQLPP